jgi:hypothetical protein
MTVKRVYTKKTKSAIRKKALEQLRQTRAQITAHHPQLLDDMRKLIEGKVHAEESEIIDRKKNLQAVMMFLELKKEHSPVFQSTLKKIILETQKIQ